MKNKTLKSMTMGAVVAGLLSSVSPMVVGVALADDNTLFRKPTVSKTHIVFSYAGDLWKVDRAGGEATRLTNSIGVETDPQFSPDGTSIAFSGQYDGNTDVFTVPLMGGNPKRLTYHPGADLANGWSVDGSTVVFSSRRNSFANFLRLFEVSATNPGSPAQLPLPSVERGSFNASGTHIAYEPLNQWQENWKRYKGGQQDRIWIADLSDSSVVKVPHGDGSDKNPMWIGDEIYFLSDRTSEEGTVTLWAYDTQSKKVSKKLRHDALDLKSASAGPDGVIAYEQFGTIHLFDTKTGKSSKVDISVSADFVSMRPKFKNVASRVANGSPSPTGKRAVFEARGEIFTAPAKKGEPRNITNTPGVMERTPAWSPDGKSIAYFSDAGGEYNLHVRDQLGKEPAKVHYLPKGFYRNIVWSPDSKMVAFNDKTTALWILDLSADNPKAKRVDHNIIGFNDDVMEAKWSPDGNWLAYTKQGENLLRTIKLYNLESGEITTATDGMSDVRYVAFDKDGKYIHFTASTNMGPRISFADLSGSGHDVTRSVYTMVLAKETKSPLAPESDEEKVKEDKKEDADKPDEKKAEGDKTEDKPKDDKAKEKPKKVTKIDLDGLQNRVIALPFPSKNYGDLTVDSTGTVFVIEMIPVDRGPSTGTLHSFSFKDKKVKEVTVGLRGFEVSADGKSALMRKGGNWSIAPTMGLSKPAKPGEGLIATSKFEAWVDPTAEYAQMYHATWRGQRDFFYDKNGHGIDFDKMEKRYQPFLANVKHSTDLEYLFHETMNEMTVGHMYVRGGERDRPKSVPGGLLGADYVVDNDRYKITKIYNGESWNPNMSGPLSQPGLNVEVGSYVLAVNGREVTSDASIFKFFESTAGKQTRVKISMNGDGSDAREITVVPVTARQEGSLRRVDWVEGNRRKVDELSGGQLAYVHMPHTGNQTSFNRYFFSQTNKHGVVLDERFNGGGSLADYIVQIFTREHLGNIAFRDEDIQVPVPAGAIYGPKAMIINERAGSGGDAMPWFFKKAGVGKLVGKQTWGGLVAAFGLPPLMDGSSVRSPDAAIYGTDGEWEVENFGVEPDIEVDWDPAQWRKGRDPQLEATVKHLLGELKKNPPKKSKKPKYPVYKRN
jgi:tricorn protease